MSQTADATRFRSGGLASFLAFSGQPSRRTSRALILAVFVASAAFGVVSGDRLRYPDEYDYNRLAQSLQSGKGYLDSQDRPTAARPPGWPFLLSWIYRTWDRPLAAKLINALAYAATAWLLSIWVARIVPAGRIFVPLLFLMYPLGLHAASTLYPQTLGAALLSAILILLDGRRHVAATTGVAGVLLGLLVLAIPAFLLVTPLILLGIFLPDRRRPARVVCRSALLLVCTVAVIAPWTLRNARVFGRFIPVSTNSGENLLFGNSENTGPNSGVNVDIMHYRKQVRELDEAEIDARFRQFAVDWIRGHPGAAAKLYVLKALNYFNFRNELYVKTEESRLKDAVMFVSYYPLLLIAIVRLGLYHRRRLSPTEVMLYVLYFGNAFASAVFFTRIRFRVPFDALLIAIVAVALGLLLREVMAAGERKLPDRGLS